MRSSGLFASLSRLAKFSDSPGNGVTRFSWSHPDRQARLYLTQELRRLKLSPYQDGIGNVRAVMKGTKGGSRVIIGSHLDSVRNGGTLDGAYGVIAALEVLRTLHDEEAKPLLDIEFIAFAEEEGSNFGSTCLGSKAVTGQAGVDDLKELRDASGQRAYDVLRAFGLNPDALPNEQIAPSSVAAFLEVHIEQGPRLEETNKRLGLVTAISGMRLMAFAFCGRSNHAASPMHGRRDPLAAFAEAAALLENLWKTGEFPQDLSCTIGKVECAPNVGIVVPEKVTFTVDLRHVDVPVLETARSAVETAFEEIAAKRGVSFETHLLSASGGVRMHETAMNALRSAARDLGVDPEPLVSGPAHDAASMGSVVPAGLLFVPSVNGLSHCPQEFTLPKDLELGAAVLEKAVRSLAF